MAARGNYIDLLKINEMDIYDIGKEAALTRTSVRLVVVSDSYYHTFGRRPVKRRNQDFSPRARLNRVVDVCVVAPSSLFRLISCPHLRGCYCRLVAADRLAEITGTLISVRDVILIERSERGRICVEKFRRISDFCVQE